MNEAIFLWLNSLGTYLPDAFWIHITNLGDTAVALCLLLGFYRFRQERGLAILLLAVLATIVIQGLKHWFSLERPPYVLALSEFHLIGGAISSKSFPSGHTATAFVVAGILAAQYLRKMIIWPLVAAAALVGLSRIMVGVHWPADVFVGAILGWMMGFCGYRLLFTKLKQTKLTEVLSLLTLLVVITSMFVYQLPYQQFGLVSASKWIYLAISLIGLYRFVGSSRLLTRR